MTIVIATHNAGKLHEMNILFRKYVSSAKEVDLISLNKYPDMPVVEEDGLAFHTNARKKALYAADFTGKMAIADDSGLVVDALSGEPGIFSARYAGENATDEENIEKLLVQLAEVPKESRTARFMCTIAIAMPGELLGIFEGTCNGLIGTEPRGDNGFGYDPVFVKTDYGKTFAELPHDVKNRISHRVRAFEKAAVIIERYIQKMYAE